jgi:hypothetical protein
MSTDECGESVQSLLARRASVKELLQNGAVSAEIVRGTLVLKNGSASLFALKELLKAHGCKFDQKTKKWRRPSVTVAERHEVSALKARDNTAVAEMDAVINVIIAHVNAIDAQVQNSTWVGIPSVGPAPSVITPEARAAAWARHGLTPPIIGAQRRDVYGNLLG